MTSVFAEFRSAAWPLRFTGRIRVERLAGGIPSDPKVVEGWMRTKIMADDDVIRTMIAETMVERGVEADEAAKLVGDLRTLNGFKRDEKGLYIEGRQLKACIREAANIRWPDRKWGPTRKGTKSYIPEHIIIPDWKLYLGIEQADEVIQKFVHSRFGASVAYFEVIHGAEFTFALETDQDWTPKEWGLLWATAEATGIGAERSAGYGMFEVIEWTRD